MRVIICDDDILFLQHFRHTIMRVFNEHQRMAEIICVRSGAELFHELNKKACDVLFLDIDIPNEDGFSIARRISKLEDKPLLVFATSIESLVFESFEHEPIWYLLKNNLNQLPVVINKIISKLEQSKKYFEIVISNIQYRFLLSDIIFFESKDHYITVHTRDNSCRFRGKLNDIEKQIDSKSFIRCHASYLVNFQYIQALGRSRIFLSGDVSIPISRNKLKKAQDSFMNYKRGLRL